MGYFYLNVSINIVNDAGENLVNFGPLTPELTERICELLHGMTQQKKLADILDRFSQPFHRMKALWVQMIDLHLVFRFIKGRCHGNQIALDEVMNAN